MITCPWCGLEVDTNASGVMRRIVGWEETRRAGGANKIAYRVEMGVWAHKPCVDAHDGDMRESYQVSTLFD